MKPVTRIIRDGEEAARFFAFLGNMPMPYTASVINGDKRSTNQNSLLHKWFGEIALHIPGDTLIDVKGRSHHKYGLPIKLQDAQFAWVWERTGAKMTYEQQCSYLAGGTLTMSSGMTRPQLSKYMDEMKRDYQAQGIVLTHPEDQHNG